MGTTMLQQCIRDIRVLTDYIVEGVEVTAGLFRVTIFNQSEEIVSTIGNIIIADATSKSY